MTRLVLAARCDPATSVGPAYMVAVFSWKVQDTACCQDIRRTKTTTRMLFDDPWMIRTSGLASPE